MRNFLRQRPSSFGSRITGTRFTEHRPVPRSLTVRCLLAGCLGLGSVILTVVAPSTVWAQTANFGEITLSSGFGTTQVQGTTAGFFGLSNIVGRDAAGNLCLGYADTTPDYILEVRQDFDQLTLTVTSGEDTTLLIQGPNDNTIRCNDNASRRNADAQVIGRWQAGTYRVWVGAFDAEQRHNYVLTVSE
ncbi:MAG: hypothetical protein AAFU71_01560 [Cyanobacteria bacterium J06632_22]